MHSLRPGAYCFWRPWADVGNRALKSDLGCFTLSYSWSQSAPGDRSFGKKKESLLKCSKSSRFCSLGRASLYSAMLVLQHTHVHTHTQGIIFFLRSAESQTTSSLLTYANTHLPLLPSSSCITHVPVLPGALTHTCCRPLLSPHRMSSFLGTQVRIQPFVQLWFWMSRFLNSTFCNVS